MFSWLLSNFLLVLLFYTYFYLIHGINGPGSGLTHGLLQADCGLGGLNPEQQHYPAMNTQNHHSCRIQWGRLRAYWFSVHNLYLTFLHCSVCPPLRKQHNVSMKCTSTKICHGFIKTMRFNILWCTYLLYASYFHILSICTTHPLCSRVKNSTSVSLAICIVHWSWQLRLLFTFDGWVYLHASMFWSGYLWLDYLILTYYLNINTMRTYKWMSSWVLK